MPAQSAPKSGRRSKAAADSKVQGRVLTKRVRLEPHRARIVEEIARKENKSESEVLREGIDLLERVRARREHVPELLRFIRGPEPKKATFHLK